MTAPTRASRSLPVTLILVAAVAAGLGLWLGQAYFASTPVPRLSAALVYPQAREIPEFRLTQANGKPLTREDWLGHWDLVFFGYTNCPDVCPTTLATFKQVWSGAETAAIKDRLRVDFVSIDPIRDTPEQLAKYVAFFSPDFRASTGSDAELTQLTRALGLVYAHTVDDQGNAQVDHSSSVIIVNPQAQLVGIFRPPLNPAAILADLQTLVSH